MGAAVQKITVKELFGGYLSKNACSRIEEEVLIEKKLEKITKNYLYKLKKDIKNMFVNGVFLEEVKICWI